MKLENLNLLTYQEALKFKKEGNKKYLYGLIRKKYLVLQPEELVRQLFLLYLEKEKEYPTNRIAVEKGLEVNQLKKRCDILVFNKDYQPLILVECKAPSVKLTQKVFDQIAQYNIPLQVPYLIVTNGPDTFCCKIDHDLGTYTFLEAIPTWSKW